MRSRPTLVTDGPGALVLAITVLCAFVVVTLGAVPAPTRSENRKPTCEAGSIGTAETGLGRSAEDVDAAQLRPQALSQIGGTVRAAVVDHQDPCVGK